VPVEVKRIAYISIAAPLYDDTQLLLNTAPDFFMNTFGHAKYI